jgi:hypothetical protein
MRSLILRFIQTVHIYLKAKIITAVYRRINLITIYADRRKITRSLSACTIQPLEMLLAL